MKKIFIIILLCLSFTYPCHADTDKAQEDMLMIANEVSQITGAVDSFKTTNGIYPEDINQLIGAGHRSLSYIADAWDLKCFMNSCVISQRNSDISKEVCAWLLGESSFWNFKDSGKCKPGSFSYKFQ